MKKIFIGTRGSILALKQAEIVKNKLMIFFPEYDFRIKTIKTGGDTNQNISLTDGSVKSLFVKEIERELLDGAIDIAVHSFKDMPNDIPDGLSIASIPDREDNRDVLVSKNGEKLNELKKGAVIGTSSLRRRIQIEGMRQDIIIKELRGNIHTRLDKLDDGLYDAIVLAGAGLKRVGLESRITQYFSIDEMMPSPCQGAICLEIRKNDREILDIVSKVNDEKAEKISRAEKEFSGIFDGGCKNPIGASGRIIGNELELSGLYFGGNKLIKGKVKCNLDEYMNCAHNLAEIIRRQMDE